MKKFTPVSTSALEYFTNIVNSKNNTVKGEENEKKVVLLGLADSIKEKYDHYKGYFSATDLHKISDSEFAGTEKASLIYAYSSGGSALDTLKNDIKNAQSVDWQNKCPYCGISGIDETDHYAPKELYSEYAVMSLNLIPSCGKCNKKKGQYWRVGGARKIINFYLDEIPEHQFLFCTFVYLNDIPMVKYKLVPSPDIEESKFELISAHFKRLDLLKRYKDYTNEEVTSTIDTISAYSTALTHQEVRAGMLDKHASMVKRFGVNHWKCVLLEEMANTVEFTERMLARTKVNRVYKGLGM